MGFSLSYFVVEKIRTGEFFAAKIVRTVNLYVSPKRALISLKDSMIIFSWESTLICYNGA
jgi:hypothetical protein